MINASQVFAKCQRMAERCRQAKGFKQGALSARSAEKADVGSLYVYQFIGAGFFGDGVTADSVRRALDGLKGIKTLDIYINSEGGDVFEAKAIYAQLKRFDAKKVVHIDGIAASAATFLAMAGDEIVTAPEATWMIHEAWGWTAGSSGEMRDYADLLDMMNGDIAAIYAKRTGNDEAKLRSWMADTTWMNAQEALDKKFTDSIATYGDDEGDATAKAPDRGPAAALAASESLVRNMTSDLLTFRASRAKEQAEKSKSPVPVRASAANRGAPASR